MSETALLRLWFLSLEGRDREAVTHVMGCRQCRRELVARLEKMQAAGECETIDPEFVSQWLAERERCEAERVATERLVADLLSQAPQRQAERVKHEACFATAAVADVLLERGTELLRREPLQAGALGELALAVPERLSPDESASELERAMTAPVEELEARAWTLVAGSRAARGDAPNAAVALREALSRIEVLRLSGEAGDGEREQGGLLEADVALHVRGITEHGLGILAAALDSSAHPGGEVSLHAPLCEALAAEGQVEPDESVVALVCLEGLSARVGGDFDAARSRFEQVLAEPFPVPAMVAVIELLALADEEARPDEIDRLGKEVTRLRDELDFDEPTRSLVLRIEAASASGRVERQVLRQLARRLAFGLRKPS